MKNVFNFKTLIKYFDHNFYKHIHKPTCIQDFKYLLQI